MKQVKRNTEEAFCGEEMKRSDLCAIMATTPSTCFLPFNLFLEAQVIISARCSTTQSGGWARVIIFNRAVFVIPASIESASTRSRFSIDLIVMQWMDVDQNSSVLFLAVFSLYSGLFWVFFGLLLLYPNISRCAL